MKKKIIIGLIVIVGGALLIIPLLKSEPIEDDGLPAFFEFEYDFLAMDVGDEITLKINIVKPVEKLELILDNTILKSWTAPKGTVSYNLVGDQALMGSHQLNLRATYDEGQSKTDYRTLRVLSDIIPEELRASVITTYPHHTLSFTQGLEFYKGKLYEGTGDPKGTGMTRVAVVDLETGEWSSGKSMSLGPDYFGEGITILNEKLYQLTWQDGKCFVYDVNDFHGNIGDFEYKGEGWGLCNDGKSLIMSDGSQRITFRNAETFAIERTFEVYDNLGPVAYLNELEFIDGLIYANVWQSPLVKVIDPKTGKVLRSIDASELITLNGGTGDVLNGIAHNPATGKTYMTGKYWSKLFEVEFNAIEVQLP
ncbi:MAG: glutamine cyclotransferase [Crocinitomicaceae bacterium]|jgi:glutamine cyclotransferase